MQSPKRKLSTDDQLDSEHQDNTHTNLDSPTRSYALIETDPNELDHIIDLLRQFFPKTKILEYHNSLATSESQQQTPTGSNYTSQFSISSLENDHITSRISSPIFKGKVKDYLQRRYLGQLDKHEQPHKEILIKSRSNDINSSHLSLINDKSSNTWKSRSLDLSYAMSTEHFSRDRSQNKRDSLQPYTTNGVGKITFSIDQPNDIEDKPRSFRYSFSEQSQQTNHLLLPHPQSIDQDQSKLTSPYPSTIPLPLTPYSVASDPGPFHSPWFNTPTSPVKFRFPQNQEQIHVNAQGSIAQLSSLTKMLCDEPSVFTPISPRFKIEKHDMKTSKDSSSSVSPCQICRQEFDSHQTYLTHYRTHLERSSENEQSDSSNTDIPSNDLRSYSCKTCSKRFSRGDMLNRHLRLHSGVRPYRCTLCNTYFSRSDHLSTHLRTHTGEKPYTCPQCSYTACRRDMITRHLKIHMKQTSERKNATSEL